MSYTLSPSTCTSLALFVIHRVSETLKPYFCKVKKNHEVSKCVYIFLHHFYIQNYLKLTLSQICQRRVTNYFCWMLIYFTREGLTCTAQSISLYLRQVCEHGFLWVCVHCLWSVFDNLSVGYKKRFSFQILFFRCITFL